MVNSLVQVGKYVHYYLAAANSKGHGIHSPFVFDLVTKVFNDDRLFYAFEPIEQLRKEIEQRLAINTEDESGNLLSPKFDQLLFRLVHYRNPGNIIAIGNSAGINTAYLASANANTPVYALEPIAANTAILNGHFIQLGLHNIQLFTGNISEHLNHLLDEQLALDIVLLNANNNSALLISLFDQLIKKVHPGTMFILNHIHANQAMERVWERIKQDESVTLTVDLFHLGLVFFRKENIIKENFIIRF